MANNYMNKQMADRLCACMRQKNIATSDVCKILNTNYNDFIATLEGRSPCFNKWQNKISELLKIDKKELFKEFYLPHMTETEIRIDERTKILKPIHDLINAYSPRNEQNAIVCLNAIKNYINSCEK